MAYLNIITLIAGYLVLLAIVLTVYFILKGFKKVII